MNALADKKITAPIVMAANDGYVAGDKNKNTENFPVGSFLIRKDLRPYIHAFYNFARASDDIADNPLMPPETKLKLLSAFEAIMPDDAPPAESITGVMRAKLLEKKIIAAA